MTMSSRWSETSRSAASKLYGTIYSTYELPGTRIYRNNEVQHGLVTLSDGTGPGRPARLELNNECLFIQVPLSRGPAQNEVEEPGPDSSFFVGENARIVTVQRDSEHGFGFSIKGGAIGACRSPIVISKVWRYQDNIDRHKQLLVGDTLIELNGVNIENKSHDDVVNLLKSAGDKVQLKLKHQKEVAAILKKKSNSRSQISIISDVGTISSVMSNLSPAPHLQPEAPKGWKTVASLPLPMAYITRYLWGTDKIRPNAFEVRSVDGSASGLIYCEDARVVEQWVQNITKNIVRLNNKSIKLSNKFLHPDELIVFLGWICEKSKEPNNNNSNLMRTGSGNKEFWQSWEPRFLILKGSEVCLFETPPLNTEDLNKCIVSYRIVETRFKDIKEAERLDLRSAVFGIETATGAKHYFSVESELMLRQLRSAYHRSIYYTVNRIQSKTFACNVEERPSGIVLDVKHGIGLYDIHKKKYVWRFTFGRLQNSYDDGKMHVRFSFRNPTNRSKPFIVDADCSDIYPLIYTLHSFLLARVMSADPEFVEKTNL